MSDKEDKFSSELDGLIERGEGLRGAMFYACYEEDFVKRLKSIHKNDVEKVSAVVKALPDFVNSYQTWYSEAQALIKQVLPDRFADFNSYYESSKPRKELQPGNYTIRDYLQGLQVVRFGEVKVDKSNAISEFLQQLNMVKAARSILKSSIMNLRAVVQADLFDREIDAAATLAKAGYLRATGAICGVIIEKHLLEVCSQHNITVKKKNPGISDLNQILKDCNLLTIPQWRFIQHLADIRNICDHAKGREPSREEIDDLLAGCGKITKTVF